MQTLQLTHKTQAHMALFSWRPLDLKTDLECLYQWVTSPKATFWGLMDKDINEVKATYEEILKHSDVYIGLYQGEAQFLVEVYQPKNEPFSCQYECREDDYGMHIFIAPSNIHLTNFSLLAMQYTLHKIFDKYPAGRIVVEPDICNTKIHRLNTLAGFRYQKTIQLPNKTAFLATLTQEDCEALTYKPHTQLPSSGSELRLHLLHKLLVKALSECLHERLIEAKADENGGFLVHSDDQSITLFFKATLLPLEHWVVEANSIDIRGHKGADPFHIIDFVSTFRQQLGINDQLIATYIEEVESTVNALEYKFQHNLFSSEELVHADFQLIEKSMIEGHPIFIANSGKVGFSKQDFERYAPEASTGVQLQWLACHKSRTEFYHEVSDAYNATIQSCLSQEDISRFKHRLIQQGLKEEHYLWIPIHPWQWTHQLERLYATDISLNYIVNLGFSTDTYQPQQSIRTFFNQTRPKAPYIKVALSILNMGFVRGLSADYMSVTPAINQWVADKVQSDDFFQTCGFSILKEYAAIGYRQPHYDACTPKGGHHKKVLAALWRENPYTYLDTHEKPMTMAALLHKDVYGQFMIGELIKASGLEADEWIDKYLQSYFLPLLHSFFAHDMVFMPHGENIILKMHNHVPAGCFLKDIGEEVALFDTRRALPASVSRIQIEAPDQIQILSIFTDMFDCFFRHLTEALWISLDYSPHSFWQCVSSAIVAYQEEHPNLSEKFKRHNLFCDEFLHSCLNRLQLSNNQHMLNLEDPAGGLKFAGSLKNPIAS